MNGEVKINKVNGWVSSNSIKRQLLRWHRSSYKYVNPLVCLHYLGKPTSPVFLYTQKMTDLEKCDQPQSTVFASTPELDASTLCSFNCQSPTSTVTLSSPGDANNCTKSDGGHKAKLTVLGSFIALFCTFGQINAFGTYQSWYSSHQLQRMSPSAISWIGSLQLWVLFFLVRSILVPHYGSVIQRAIQGGFIGRIFDSYGPFGLMVCGTTLYFLSTICTSFSSGYQEYLLSQGVLFGISVAFL